MSDERFVEAPPGGAEGWREVWEQDLRYRPRPSRYDFLLRFLRRLTGRATEPELERQKNFNVALMDLLSDAQRSLDAAREDLKRDLTAVQADVRSADESLAQELARLRELIPVAARRNDALIAALDQKIETVDVRVRDLTNPSIEHVKVDAVAPSDLLYRRLEDALRGSGAGLSESAEHYARLASDAQPLLDVGCGRGELLAACRDAGVKASGFDTNERSVADLVARGFDASIGAIPQCFAAIEAGSLGAVAAIHVVEHLPVDALFALFAEAARVLRPGGLLMIETPNAESLAVTGSEFWRDPTHLAPRHPAALTLLGREYGFAVEEVRPVHPFPEGNRFTASEDDAPSLRRLVEALNERLFGGQDLRLILRK